MVSIFLHHHRRITPTQFLTERRGVMLFTLDFQWKEVRIPDLEDYGLVLFTNDLPLHTCNLRGPSSRAVPNRAKKIPTDHHALVVH